MRNRISKHLCQVRKSKNNQRLSSSQTVGPSACALSAHDETTKFCSPFLRGIKCVALKAQRCLDLFFFFGLTQIRSCWLMCFIWMQQEQKHDVMMFVFSGCSCRSPLNPKQLRFDSIWGEILSNPWIWSERLCHDLIAGFVCPSR